MERCGTEVFATGDEAVGTTQNKFTETPFSSCSRENSYCPSTLGSKLGDVSTIHQDPAVATTSPESNACSVSLDVGLPSDRLGSGSEQSSLATQIRTILTHKESYSNTHTANALPQTSPAHPSKLMEQEEEEEGKSGDLPSTTGTSVGLNNASLKTDNIQIESHYVYDGGGSPTNSSRSHPNDTTVSVDFSNVQEDSNRPCNVQLLPRPEEQIAPPTNGIPVSHSQGDVQARKPMKPACTSPRSKQKATSQLNMSNSAQPVPPEESHLLPVESSTTASRKRLIHDNLSYKSKCRSYKIFVVSLCYLALVLLVLAVRYMRNSKLSTEDQEKLPQTTPETESEYDDYHYLSREKRHAAGGYKRVGNSSECVPVYDENHNEIYIMSYDAFIMGGFLVHILIGMYTFAAIAAICDIYFVPALEHICEDLKLEADVAGATFMAAASSAPEFCTSVIGIFVQESDVGLGAIVGSSIFNLLAIIGLCGIFAGMPVKLSWYPLSRDSIFYGVAVFEMLAFMFDAKIYWYEALVMIMTYLLYILVMVYNRRIEQYLSTADSEPPSRESSIIKEIHKTHSARLEIIRARSHSRVSMVSMNEARLKRMSMLHVQQSGRSSHTAVCTSDREIKDTPLSNEELQMARFPLDDLECEISNTRLEGTPADPKKVAHVVDEPIIVDTSPPVTVLTDDGNESAVAEYENPLEFPEGWSYRIYWIAVLPVTVLHAYTIPDSRIQNSWQSRFYMIPFAMSVFYLAVYSYIMVWAMSVAAWGLDIPVTITGLTILAAGTSVPDCLSSIFVARDGYGDMAVSNAIGSNVFDILLCLGVPWLCKGITQNGLQINSEGMLVAGSTLVVTIIYLVVSLRLSNWTLTPLYGLITLVIYVVVIVFCILVELNILFQVHAQVPC